MNTFTMEHPKLNSVENRPRRGNQFSKLEKGVSKFCNSLHESTQQNRFNKTNSNIEIKNDINNDDNMNMNIDASDIVQASAFLQSQHDKLSRIESSLPSLVDLLLDLDNVNADDQQSNQQFKNKLSLTELSSRLRHLHSCHAKQILHIESTLVSQYGYITTSLQDTSDSNNPNLISNSNDLNHHGCDSPLALWKPEQEQLNQLTPLHAPLSRLSEVTLETDGGTPGSTLLGSSLGSTHSYPNSSNSNQHHHKITPKRNGGNGGVLMALVEDGDEDKKQESTTETVDVDIDVDVNNISGSACKGRVQVQIDSEECNNAHEIKETEAINSSHHENKGMPKTPSMEDIRLRYVMPTSSFSNR